MDPQGVDTALKGVLGGKAAKALGDKLDLHTIGDLLRHYPRRYAKRGELTDLDELEVDENVTVLAEVERVNGRTIDRRGSKRMHLLEVTVTDGRGRLTLTFFNQSWRERELGVGTRALFAGKVTDFRGKRQLAHPDYVKLHGDDASAEQVVDDYAGKLIPIYPAGGGLQSWTIASCVKLALEAVGDPPDPIPSDVRASRALLDLRQAFVAIHRPEEWDDVNAGRRRFRFEEAFVLQTELALRRLAARSLPAKPRVPKPDGLLAAFDSRLPFQLTEGQVSIGEELLHDLAQTHPMQRLLQGEVGSGKTVIAVRAMLAVVDAGGQAVILAPTEVLAQQHHRSITALLGPLAERGLLGGSDQGTRVALLTGSQGTPARRRALLDAASADAGIVVGTHALLEDKVQFADLGLVVVDEQHRFGVEQRAALTQKAGDTPPHVLVMTATPIPRTVAMTVFGDLEISTLTELPRGRSTIQTNVVPAAEKPGWLDRTWERVREEVSNGRQIYIVCPRIGESAADEDASSPPAEDSGRPQAVAVLDVAPMLEEGPLQGLRVEALHGRLAPDLKDQVMRRFAAGEIDVLVATTVIEVGVDVPNASTMIVMDADWFGVSQLHQLRGRVGRGQYPGLCLLVTNAAAGTPSRVRLDAVASTVDGFELSRLDLEQRREGDVLGADQSGRRSSLRMLSMIRDESLIREAREDASAIAEADSTLSHHPTLASAVRSLLDDSQAEFLAKS
ncbi:ATP-dependent DNA helicase RecG [Tenggerimyces flavus]|uniref:Probable DNA 3'-5' helicase RecG n=1 Tax=Tenggerimyces flavus TaxID=1708749 RepID=A0ABV7Y7X3_9ACTN|nr:ATP-dependent DNA helicase RecG [Tenggerimyces flavus]MBM7786663.1 ATP-dependent DNA helicase RecG [Tenggerimyces flavus]